MMPTHRPARRVAIVGAGLSGLAAALCLLQRGYLVSLFEAAPQAGGRARSVTHTTTMLDNGQHLCLGAYRHTLALLQAAGVDATQVFKRTPLALHMHDGAQRMSLVAPRCLPAPLHLLWGLLTARGLDGRSKWQAIRWMYHLKQQAFVCPETTSVEALLQQGQQTPSAIRTLWEPLCLAALNTPIRLASAQVFLNVLQDSFQRKRSDSDFLVFKGDLGQTLIQPLQARIQALGGQLVTRTSVTSIVPTAQGFNVVTTAQTHAVEAVLVAVGPHQLKTLQGLPVAPPSFDYQPITTLYLQFSPETRLPHAIMGLCHGQAQWVFDRGQCCDQPGLLAVVISAHPPLTDKAALLTQCIAELNLALSAYHMQLPSQPAWSQVITEKRATFSCNTQLQRPTTLTPYPQLVLAGDYIAGRYPATIEGAIESGFQAAQALHQAG